MAIKCDYDGKIIESFPIFTPCGYTICADHLIEFDSTSIKDSSYYEKIAHIWKSIDCLICKNHRLYSYDCFRIAKNLNTLKEKIFQIKKDELIDKLKELNLIEKDPQHYIDQSYEDIVMQIDLRRELIKHEIDKYCETLIQDITKSKQKSTDTLKKKLESLNLNQKEDLINQYECEIKTETNDKSKTNLLEEKIKSIQEMLNNFKSVSEFMNKTKEVKLKTNQKEDDLKNIIGVLENYQLPEQNVVQIGLINVCKIEPVLNLNIPNQVQRPFYDKYFVCTAKIREHSDCVSDLVVMPTGELVSCSLDQMINVYEQDMIDDDWQSTKSFGLKHVSCLLALESGELACGTFDNSIVIIDIDDEECVCTFKAYSEVYCLEELSSRRIASGLVNGQIKIWNLNTQKYVKTLHGHSDKVWCLKLLESNHLASGSDDSLIKIWNVESGACLKTLFGHNDCVSCLREFETKLVSSSFDGTIKVWNVNTRECIRTLSCNSKEIFCLEILDSGEIISGSNGSIQFWNINEIGCKKMFRAHSDAIYSIKFLPLGEFATCSRDETIKIWQ